MKKQKETIEDVSIISKSNYTCLPIDFPHTGWNSGNLEGRWSSRLQISFRNEPYLGPVTSCHDSLPWFSSVPPDTQRQVTKDRSCPHPSIIFPVHSPLTAVSFDAMFWGPDNDVKQNKNIQMQSASTLLFYQFSSNGDRDRTFKQATAVFFKIRNCQAFAEQVDLAATCNRQVLGSNPGRFTAIINYVLMVLFSHSRRIPR
jgi:hypothetical protein